MKLHLGYEITDGAQPLPIGVPMHHMIITGMTRWAGKTTTIEALLSRLPEGFTSLVFRTKRGEVEFHGANRVIPYYRPEVDWEYVESLLEAAMKQRLRFERSWVIRASEGAATLREVYENIKTALDGQRIRGIDESVYTNLRSYFEKILPQLEEKPFAGELELQPGVNVMELGHLSEEVQALVISTCLDEIHQEYSRTVVVIPEAWLFLPQARGNPVKWAAQHVIRQGGASENYLWLDSQDVTTVSKDVLKSAGVWLLGRQQEINEVKRVLDQLPARQKPRPDQIMTLPVGHFYVATEDACRQVYVQPAWMDDPVAVQVSSGQKTLESIRSMRPAPRADGPPGPKALEANNDQEVVELRRRAEELQQVLAETEEERDRALFQVSEWKVLAEGRGQQVQQALEKLAELERRVQPLLGLESALLVVVENHLGPDNLKLWDGDLPPNGLIPEDLDALADEVAGRLGRDPALPPVGPLEALRKQYQEDAVTRLAAELADLDPIQRQAVRWLLAVDKSCTFREVARGLGLPIAGNGYVKFSQGVKALVATGWLHQDSHGLKSNVNEKVGKALQSYDPSPEEVEEVFHHLASKLVG